MTQSFLVSNFPECSGSTLGGVTLVAVAVEGLGPTSQGGVWVKGLARKTSRGVATVGPGVSYLLASSYILLTSHDTVITS